MLLKSTVKVGGATILSRVLGFIRDIVFARYFGASGATDAFFLAFKIPNFMRRLFAEGSFSLAFVPVLSEVRASGDRRALKDLVDHVAGTLAGILLALTAIGVFAAPAVVALFAPGWAIEGREEFWLSAGMLRITFPYLLLISLTALAGGILNTFERFLVEQRGYRKEDVAVNHPLALEVAGTPYHSRIDLLIRIGQKPFVVIKCAAGSLGSRDREVIACARIAVNDGDAELIMTIAVNPPFEIDAFSNTFPLAAGKDRMALVPAIRRRALPGPVFPPRLDRRSAASADRPSGHWLPTFRQGHRQTRPRWPQLRFPPTVQTPSHLPAQPVHLRPDLARRAERAGHLPAGRPLGTDEVLRRHAALDRSADR